MTRRILHNVLAAVVALAAIGARAETEVVDGYTWSYRINGATAEICCYDADANRYSRAVEPAPEGGVTIPATLGGKPVTRIGDMAFFGCSMMSGVEIPSSVTSFGNDAFYHCVKLASIDIPAGVTSIGDYAFGACSVLERFDVAAGNACYRYEPGFLLTKDGRTLVSAAIGTSTKAVIPDGVTDIAMGAFTYRRSLTEVEIPGSVTSIGRWAFSDCTSLECARLPSWFDGALDETVFNGCPEPLEIDYYDPPYTINFHRNDASDGKTAAYDFNYGEVTPIPTLARLLWARRGFDFKGWATSAANAAKSKVWKTDGASVSTAARPGGTLDAWAVWALKSDSYAIQFIRNDGAGTWRTVGFKHGEKTRIPSLANGLGWTRRGYAFKGWALSTADAAAEKIWKGDWAYVSTPVAKGATLTVYAAWGLKPGYYEIRFNKNDGTGKWRTLGFQCGASAKLSTIAGLGWERGGYTFRGWSSNKANADAGKVWKTDGAWVKDATAEGKTLSIYAIWE